MCLPRFTGEVPRLTRRRGKATQTNFENFRSGIYKHLDWGSPPPARRATAPLSRGGETIQKTCPPRFSGGGPRLTRRGGEAPQTKFEDFRSGMSRRLDWGSPPRARRAPPPV